jgi:formate hydrogenlyase transcriptional activator
VNVRLVAATHRDLPGMISAKEFRADLFYRLSVFPISVPPLRDRPSDIPLLARHFMAKYAETMNKEVEDIPLEAMDAMVSYDWPGNIRQLQNFIEYGVILSKGTEFRAPLHQLSRQTEQVPASKRTLDDATRDHILHALEEARWVVGGKQGAAARLGIARTTLLSKMQRLRIEHARSGARMQSAVA